MRFTILQCAQRTDEWRRARVGRMTGSRAADMMATIKSGEAAARRDLRLQLVLERLTGVPQEAAYVSKDMQYGADREADAMAAYEAKTGLLMRRTGFLSHDTLMAGCSLDGDTGDLRGILELKVPKSATHLRYLRANGHLPDEYRYQVIHNLWMSGADWCDSVSFDDRFPPELRLVVVRVPRDEVAITTYELAVSLFLSEVEKEVDSVRALMAARVA